MIAPTMIGLVILNIIPFFETIRMSFYKSGSFGKWTFCGIDNYIKMFSSSGFWRSTWNTTYFVILTVPIGVFISLVLAVFLNAKIKGRTIFRAIYFLPMVVAPTAVAMVWKWMYNSEYGIINNFLRSIGISNTINWITNSKTALLACAIVAIWSAIGYDAILLLSGIQSISKSYYEAAKIDGASGIKQFFHITIPMVSPTLFFVIIMRAMTSLKMFDIIYMMIEERNPAIRSTETILMLFYKESFVNNNQGYGSAIVIWAFLIIGVVTLVQFIGQKKWVNYET
ncbi:carbohydrate ABC transporter permease [Anaerosacchariphilus polymeriproducens]|uniref:Sugar ABC transporter permease n=1 Tax=Anaerosacchariphilus polymeriproducens TaxID=1812858 RepID=A0A371AT79_9FIRM|nr:sugar ABC transporter permease [Anaerosacchariphilus polymeriproducens]RDU22670.1 sugar ABC transporter permease [Anaerosacchariphilus polymeriproducens]